MKIGLLICGKLPAPMERGGRGYVRLIEEWLGPHLGNSTIKTYRAYEGKLPPKTDSCDSYFVSGSRASLLDNEPWMLRLTDFLLVAAKAQIPCFGLCFGHQALAKALGGNVKRTGRWELGVKTWKVIRDEGWLRECGKQLRLISIHTDQVSKLPPRSVRVATSPTCANGMFRLAGHAIGMQGHPEFTPAVFEEILKHRGKMFTPAEIEAALASLDQPCHAVEMAKWCMSFIEARA